MTSQQRTSGKPRRRLVGGVRARLADESGLALVLALIVVAALSASTASMIMLVTSNQTAVGRDRQEERAFNMAEAGLNEAVSYLSTQNTLLISSVSPTDFSLDNGTGQWSATKTATTPTVDTWTLYSRATSGNVSRKVSVQLAANKSVINTPSWAGWGKGFFIADKNTCASMSGASLDLNISVYAAGDLCLNATKIIEPTPASPSLFLYVGGDVLLEGGPAGIGTGPQHCEDRPGQHRPLLQGKRHDEDLQQRRPVEGLCEQLHRHTTVADQASRRRRRNLRRR